MYLRVNQSSHASKLRRFLRAGLALQVPSIAFCAGLTACHPHTELETSALRCSVEPAEAVVGNATFTLTLVDPETGEGTHAAAVEVEGNMTHAGMTPVFGTARNIAGGRYQVELPLSMAGDWYLFVRAELPDRTVARNTVKLRVRPDSTTRGAPWPSVGAVP